MISGFHVGNILKSGSEHDKHFKTPSRVKVLWQTCLLTFRRSNWLGPKDGVARSQNVRKPKQVTRKRYERPKDPFISFYETFKKELIEYAQTRLQLHRFMRHLVCGIK
jgi:hypothetical protein